jgi:predicted nucleic acid-binding protein
VDLRAGDRRTGLRPFEQGPLPSGARAHPRPAAALIELPHLKLSHKRLYRRVFELYTTLPIDYVDAYHAAFVERDSEKTLYNYDADFDRVQSIRRLES